MVHLHLDPSPHDDEIENAIMAVIDERILEEEERLFNDHSTSNHECGVVTLPPPLPDNRPRPICLDPDLLYSCRLNMENGPTR